MARRAVEAAALALTAISGRAKMRKADNSVDYIEFPAADIAAMKHFYGRAFGWTFTGYGPEYASFEGAGVDGGFRGEVERPPRGGSLVVLYVADLEAAEMRVRSAGGEIAKPIFDFPGGRRFHFLDPTGNELAIWSDGG
jgi:uncharacterized protein